MVGSSFHYFIKQYRLEPTKIIHVIKICEFFNHPSQMTAEFTSHLLDSIKTIILTTDNQEALEACAAMIERLSDQDFLKPSCNDVLESIISTTIAYFSNRSEGESDSYFGVVLLRLASLARLLRIINIDSWI
ncbi:hypothetical protein MXB_2810 [Myxobolus squamalis]|nr:hypothetical protein MXB_2810 [Myxobolus squamalis]